MGHEAPDTWPHFQHREYDEEDTVQSKNSRLGRGGLVTPLAASILLLTLTPLAACTKSTIDHQEPSTSAAIGYGTVMADVARRFELLGGAASAGRYELADYQLGEIEEQFLDALPHATPPREGHPEVLPAMTNAFAQSTIVNLRNSLAAHDRTQFNEAFKLAASACNRCHQASGHGFIEVPTTPGRTIPNTDALPASPP